MNLTRTSTLWVSFLAATVVGCFGGQSGNDPSIWGGYGGGGTSIGGTNPSQPPASASPTYGYAAIDYSSVHSGDALYYTPDTGGSCSFDLTGNDLMVAAINKQDYSAANACGAYVRVDGPNGSVTVRIVDMCLNCKVGDIDLSQHAYSQIADIQEGITPVNWQFVQAPIGGNLQYRLKVGSTIGWTAVQIRNHLHPIVSMEMKRLKGKWRKMVRQPYNYFVYEKGMGAGPWSIRVTDIFGQIVQDDYVQLYPGELVWSSYQFPEVTSSSQPPTDPGTPPVDGGGDGTDGSDPETPPPVVAPDFPSGPDGIELTYDKEEFPGGYCATIFAENPGDEYLDWYAELDFAGKLKKIWNCSYALSEGMITLYGLSHNAGLSPGGYTECGFCTDL